MHRVPNLSGIEVEGLLFHVTTLDEPIPDGPKGVFIDRNLLEKGRVLLRTDERPSMRVHFVTKDRSMGGNPTIAPLVDSRSLSTIDRSNKRGWSISIDVFVEWTANIAATRDLFEGAIDASAESLGLQVIAQSVLTESFDASLHLVTQLRQSLDQYWLAPQTNILQWGYVIYFSRGRGDGYECYSVVVPDDFWPGGAGWPRSSHHFPETKMFRTLYLEELQTLHTPVPNDPVIWFPDEMISTALIELHNGRIRSAILHGFMALEAAVLGQTGEHLTSILGTGEDVRLVELIIRNLGVLDTARLIELQLDAPARIKDLKWESLAELHNSRNTIVHRGQRRMPKGEQVLEQLTEVRRYVREVEQRILSPT